MAVTAPIAEGGSSVLRALGLPGPTDKLIGVVKEGMPTHTFTALAGMLGISEAALAKLTGISVTTLTRRKRGGRLAPAESEHVLRLARLLDEAVHVFEDVESAAAWLRSDNLSLGGDTPLAYADTEVGAREVENLLGRIDYGVYS